MIVGTVDTWMRYGLGPAWEAAFAVLSGLGPDAAGGRHPVPGRDAFVEVGRYETRPEGSGRLEAHRKYIDIQYVLSGMEWLEWTPLAGLAPLGPHDADRDVRFFMPGNAPGNALASAPGTRVLLRPGMFAALFPEDAHMPGIAVNGCPLAMTKAVAKVRVEDLAVLPLGL